MVLLDSFHSAQPPRNPECTTAMVHRGLATASADGRLWYHPCDGVFTSTQYTCKSCGVSEASNQISEGGLEARQRTPEKVVHESVGLKAKMLWKPQKVVDSRNVECLPRKITGCEWNQPKRESVWAATTKAVRVGLSRPFGTHILPSCALDVRYRATGLNTCLAGFQSWFGPILV